MKIVFERVRYQNIMSVGQSPVDITLNDVQKALVTGKNGFGKSTFIEAVYFALFGKPFRDIKKGQLINSINKKALLVEVWFTADNTKFYIKRGQKPNVFEVHKDGVTMDEVASAKDFQNILEEMIGMNSTSFKQTTILGTAGYTPFMSLKTPERRALVEDLLEVSVLGAMDKLNKGYIRELTQNINAIESHISHLVQQINTHEAYIQKQKEQMNASNDRYEAAYKTELAKAKETKLELDALRDQLSAIVLPEPPTDATPYIEARFKLKAGIDNYGKVVSLYQKGGNCPTCSQVLTGGCDNAQQALTDYSIKIEKVNKKLTELNRLSAEYRNATQQFNDLQQKVRTKESMVRSYADSAARMKAMMDQEVQKIDIDYTELERLKEERLAKVEQKSVMVLEKYNRGFITEMLKDNGIKAGIIKKYIPFFNSRIQHYLEIMGADYVFTLDESFNETIKSRGREAFSYTSFSQGEKARIDVALLFTWRDVASMVSGSACNLLVLDEVFDGSFDTEGLSAVKEIIDSMAESNVYVISHKDHDPQDFGKHIKMIKKGRFSVCETTVF